MRYSIASRTGMTLAVTALLGLTGSLDAQNTSHSGGHNSHAMQPPPQAMPSMAAAPAASNDPIDAAQLPLCSATVMDACREKASTAERPYHRRQTRRPH